MTEHQNRACAYFLQEQFQPVGRESYAVFKQFDNGNMLIHETTATVSVIWGFAFNALYKIIRGNLCSIWFYQNGEIYIILQRPWETPECSLLEIVDALYGLSFGAGLHSLRIWAVEERFLKEYLAIEGYSVESECNGDWSEYAYRTKDLLELSGGVNLNKRNRLKKFLDMPNISLCPISGENIRLCLEIEEEWCKNQDCEYCASFSGCAKKSLEIMLDIFDERVYGGFFGYIDNIPVAYAIWERVNEKIAFVYFAKSNVPNFNVYLYYMMVKMYLSDVEYVNISSDMGKQGLRTFKKHLGSYELWSKYLCILTKKEGTKR